jgi:dTDP-4-dehydrorhamnose 3,5-epimerase
MIFTPLELAEAYLIAMEPQQDQRGYYAQSWSAREFKTHGLSDRLVECGISYNRRRGTVRGMHRQVGPHVQAKLVRCSRGAMYDVIIDLRPDSPTYGRWMANGLSAERGTMLYVPEGFAHGFQTIVDDTEVLYQMSHDYHPEAERGIRWNDPRFAIPWPLEDLTISEKDRSYRDFQS